MAKEFLRPAEVAKILGVSRGTVINRIKNGQIPCVQFSERIKLVPAGWTARLKVQAEGVEQEEEVLADAIVPTAEDRSKDNREIALKDRMIFLTTREVNVLREAGITRWGQLADMTPMQLRATKGIWSRSLVRIRASLGYLGLELRSGYVNNLKNLVQARKAKKINRTRYAVVEPTI